MEETKVTLNENERAAAEEITKAKKKLNRYGARETEILTAGADLLEEPTTVVRVRL